MNRMSYSTLLFTEPLGRETGQDRERSVSGVMKGKSNRCTFTDA